MKKSIALPIIISSIVLLTINSYFIISSAGKPPILQKPSLSEVNGFIADRMEFDENQRKLFLEVAENHHNRHVNLLKEYQNKKRQLNELMIEGDKVEVNQLIKELSSIVEQKESELFLFFQKVFEFSTEEQKRRFGKIFAEATRQPEYAK